ncbi:complement C1q subcomponent subunit C-like [Heptranchias perlo]|uniref:complement C1q subcomponent subunit C-like n=1 Tax=Heptranchias perlo TaxID=212740 RepID=UPI003559D4F7
MSDMGKMIWLCALLCHCNFWTVTSDDCPALSQITVQKIKDAIDKTQEIDALKQKVNHLEEQVAKLIKHKSTVIFHAKVSNGKHPQNQNPVIYDVIVVNQRSAYNASSGTFTATVPGFYYFTYSLLGQQHARNTAAHLVKNGEDISYLHSILANNEAQTSSMTVILSLTKGDRVWVRVEGGITWSANGSMNFQGVLLEAAAE